MAPALKWKTQHMSSLWDESDRGGLLREKELIELPLEGRRTIDTPLIQPEKLKQGESMAGL